MIEVFPERSVRILGKDAFHRIFLSTQTPYFSFENNDVISSFQLTDTEMKDTLGQAFILEIYLDSLIGHMAACGRCLGCCGFLALRI